MAFLKSLLKGLAYVVAVLVAITFIPGIPPDATFAEYDFVRPNELSGKLAVNEKLNNPEILFQGQIKGPETFASYNGELYTGAHGGYVLKVTKNKLVPVVKFGKECDGLWQDSKCGRPLGLKFDKKGNLYVADTYYGIFKVDVKTGKYEKVVDNQEPIEGRKSTLINSLDVASNGDIYWTDSCSDFRFEDGVYCLLTNPSGRLIRYNAATKKNQVLVHDLGFANGVVLSEDESYVMVSETTTSRVTKYYIVGPKAGKREIIVEGLPGLPDNIHPDGKNGYLIGMAIYADSQNPVLSQAFVSHPHLRRLGARLLTLIEAPFKCLQTYYPNSLTEKIIYYIGNFESTLFLAPKITNILRIDSNGKIIDAAYGIDGKISDVSSAYVHDGFLWIGSPFSEYIARIPLEKVFPDLVISEPQKLTQKKKNSQELNKDSIPKSTVEQKSKASEKPTPKVAKPQSSAKTDSKKAPKK